MGVAGTGEMGWLMCKDVEAGTIEEGGLEVKDAAVGIIEEVRFYATQNKINRQELDLEGRFKSRGGEFEGLRDLIQDFVMACQVLHCVCDNH
ncbi:hypothetical protein SNE40_013028 [Patella caerulea]|uniref:Uncharacterized protein n=1 Tax=Patella caerulea TaxID=87958 RepID=A0AAN8JNN2_PATCE